MHDSFHAVAAVYEDRHLLCSFGPQAQLLQCSMKARRVKVSQIPYHLYISTLHVQAKLFVHVGWSLHIKVFGLMEKSSFSHASFPNGPLRYLVVFDTQWNAPKRPKAAET